AGEKPFPMIPAVDHYAGSEKLINKALQLQSELGPIFDITCDCEDGAPAGADREHAEMVAGLIMSAGNRHQRVGVRVHDIAHPGWQQDLEIIVASAGQRLAFVTLPKVNGAADVHQQLRVLQGAAAAAGVDRAIPVHVLIETYGALRDVWEIAALPEVESLDFGLMDFVSGHHGA
ncbi:MAG TPA: CoA ester lyase, partial [Candidatus Accumulibacter sp.]|nr:CoA ester lyase [Accumulibacter sp.]